MKRIFYLAVIVAVLLITGCEQPDPFGEYNDENFLSSTSLETDKWVLMPDYSFETGTGIQDYMDFSKSGGASGPAGGPVYRLEIKNLVENGGFEDKTNIPWFVYDKMNYGIISSPYPGNIVIVKNDMFSIDENTIKLNAIPNTHKIAIALKDSFVNEKAYIPGMDYLFKLDYRTASSLEMSIDIAWDNTDDTEESSKHFLGYGGPGGANNLPHAGNRNTFPPLDPLVMAQESQQNIFTAGNKNDSDIYDIFSFDSDNIQSASFDNFRIVRDSRGDFDYRLRLKMDSDHRSDLQMIMGYYRFSVWVTEESISTTLNNYHADRVELGIISLDAAGQEQRDSRVFYKTQEFHALYSGSGKSWQGSWNGKWIKLVIESSLGKATELTISPSNPGNGDAGWNRLSPGGILVADPVLEYSSSPW